MHVANASVWLSSFSPFLAFQNLFNLDENGDILNLEDIEEEPAVSNEKVQVVNSAS